MVFASTIRMRLQTWLTPVSVSPGELQLPPASLENSLRSAGRSDPGSFQITASALAPSVCEILCESFKSRVFISPSPVRFLKVSLTGIHSQTFWGLIYPVSTPRLESPM